MIKEEDLHRILSSSKELEESMRTISADDEESVVNETLAKLPASSSTAKTTEKLPLTNPGEPPPLK